MAVLTAITDEQRQNPHVSASQLKTFALCGRKWAFEKLDGRAGKSGVGAQEGSEFHDWMQRYHERQYEYEDLPKVCQAVVDKAEESRLGPALREEDVYAELEFEWKFEDIRFVGKIDVLDTRDPKHPIIYDYKFLKDAAQYGLTSQELLMDPQAVLYAMVILDSYPEAEDVRLRWLNVDKRKKEHPVDYAMCVFRKFGKNPIWPAFEKYVVTNATSIRGHYRLTKCADDVVANGLACGAYGGCPHAEYCDAPEPDAKAAIDLLFGKAEDMALPPNLKKPSSSAPVVAAPAKKAAPVAAPAAKVVPVKPKAAPAPVAAPAPTVKRFKPSAAAVAAKPAPVEVEEEPLPVEEEEETTTEETDGYDVQSIGGGDVEEGVEEAAPEETEEEEPASPPAAKKRGRPAGSKNASTHTNELLQQLLDMVHAIGVGAGFLEGDE